VLKQLGADETIEQITSSVSSSKELFWTVRARFEAAAAERPLIVVFDDIHWGEPAFLDLIDNIADLSRGEPILLLCVARPELLDERPAWGGGKLNATTALLEPLSADDSLLLLASLGAETVDEDTRTRIVETAGGNPLFVEEMLALAREGGDVRAPATVRALLQARLDRLGRSERSVIERGAVEGEIFHRRAAENLAGDSIDDELNGLVRKELIRPDRGLYPGEDAFRFRHLLIRDAAYDSLPKETRAELHERFATWVENHADLIELDEIAGYHLEQAALYRRELGQNGGAEEARAAEHLARAGRSAFDRGDLPAAANLLGRAVALLPAHSETRELLTVPLAEIAGRGGNFGEFDRLLAEPLASAHDRVRLRAQILDGVAAIERGTPGAADQMRALAETAAPILEALGDHQALATLAEGEAQLHLLESRGAPVLEALRRARDHLSLTSGARDDGLIAMLAATAASFGPTPTTEMEALVHELEQEGEHSPILVRHAAHLLRAFVQMYRGCFDDARDEVRKSTAIIATLGDDLLGEATHQATGTIELYADRPDAAIEVLARSYRMLLELGGISYASTQALLLARAHYLCGQVAESERFLAEGRELSDPEDTINDVLGDGLAARLAADRGELEEAERFGRSSIEAAARTDYLVMQGDAYVDLAYVLRAAGKRPEARSSLEEALARFRAKGDVVSTAKTERLLVEL
jgi:tetratricopeptide (TPR) repeat protein